MKFIDTIWEWIKDAALGFTTSFSLAAIWPEVIHGVAVVVTGIISTTIIFFLNRWLKKTFK
jgi:hypothetical protein